MVNLKRKKSLLKEQADSMNIIYNQFLFGENFETEFSKNLNTKQKSKSLFTGLKRMAQKTKQLLKLTISSTPFKEVPCYDGQEGIIHHDGVSGLLFLFHFFNQNF